MKQIFISSVQKEFEKERAAIKRMIETDPILKPHFKAFVFEIDAPAADKTTKQVYLDEIAKSDVYLVLVGDKYGYCRGDEPSPTEQEYNEAERRGLRKLVMVRGTDNSQREPREAAFLSRVSDGLVRVRYQDVTSENPQGDLLDAVRNSIRDIMIDDGILSEMPFEDQMPRDATLEDIDEKRIAWFVQRAVRLRNAPFADDAQKQDVLRSLNLLNRRTGLPTKAAVLLFGKDPQYLFPTSCVKCASYFGTEKCKPNEDLEIYDGDLFRLSDQAVAFVNRHTFHGAGTHDQGSMANDMDEIPNSAISEAINNAIAHRNYASNGSIQIEVYQDRIEVISPGRLVPPLTVDMLYGKHESVAPNPHIARAMFWVKYIETVGTGLNDLLDSCAAAGLRRPTIEANDMHFRLIIWRRSPAYANQPQITTNKPQITTNDDVIISIVREDGNLSVKKIAEKSNLTINQVRGAMDRMRSSGILIREGANRNGFWRVNLLNTTQTPGVDA